MIYFTRFMPELTRGGGSRRMLQIAETLAPFDPRTMVSVRADGLPRELWTAIKEQSLHPAPDDRNDGNGGNDDLVAWSEERRKGAYRLREVSREWARRLPAEGLGVPGLAIMDDPIYFYPLFERLKALGVPVVAVCHNLESLCTLQINKGYQWELFRREVGILAACDLVITISREESALLKNFGVPCFYLPYYPVPPILERLQGVRRRRETGEKRNILMLGSAVNPHTRGGMAIAARFWAEQRLDRRYGALLLAGYQTGEHFEPGQFGPAVDVLGPLSDPDLDHLLARVKGCLCYQEGGTGALTRIGEMLIAGVPVLADSHAARSYHERDGLIEFGDLTDLPRAIEMIDSVQGRVTFPGAPGIASLIERVNGLIGG